MYVFLVFRMIRCLYGQMVFGGIVCYLLVELSVCFWWDCQLVAREIVCWLFIKLFVVEIVIWLSVVSIAILLLAELSVGCW